MGSYCFLQEHKSYRLHFKLSLKTKSGENLVYALINGAVLYFYTGLNMEISQWAEGSLRAIILCVVLYFLMWFIVSYKKYELIPCIV